jgi:uncharacterized protein (DUF433 family)
MGVHALAPVDTEPWHLGLYSQTDAARYSGIPLSTVHRWLERRQRLPEGEDLVSFDEFVTLLFVRQLRARDVPLREILRADEDLRERTGESHPFVHETLWTAAKDILVKVPGDPDVLIAANLRGQMAMPGVVEAKRVRLPRLIEDVRGEVVYGEGRVMMWRPAERITARPAVQFGLTCVEGTRLPTRVLYEATEAGDTSQELARLHKASESDVERAVAWERRLAA